MEQKYCDICCVEYLGDSCEECREYICLKCGEEYCGDEYREGYCETCVLSAIGESLPKMDLNSKNTHRPSVFTNHKNSEDSEDSEDSDDEPILSNYNPNVKLTTLGMNVPTFGMNVPTPNSPFCGLLYPSFNNQHF